MDSKYLKYGSLITLSTTEGYYLYSQGFIDSSPYLREQTQDFSEFSGSIFRIVPQCMHSVQTSILNFIEGLREIDFSEKLPHLVKMEENLEGEIKTNLHSYNTYKGQIIRYNSFVQLEHFTSHKFLTLRSQSLAIAEKDSFKLSFEDHPSEYSHFRIVPSYKYQKHGSGKVKISDKVYLQILVPGLRRTAWMHGSKGLNLDLKLQNMTFSNSKVVNYKAIEVNVSLDFKTRWSISLYGEIMKDDKYLACGDYIWLFSPEENSTIIFKEEENSMGFVKGQNATHGLWMIEYEDPVKGGPVVEDKRYRLKHVVTGKYLCIDGNIELTDVIDENSLWKFISFKSDDFIRSDELCYLIHDSSNLTLKVDNNKGLVSSHILSEHCIYKPSKSNQDVIWEILFLLHCFPILSNFPKCFPSISDFSELNKQFLEFGTYCDSIIECIGYLQLFVENRLQSMIGIDNHFGEVQHIRQIILKEHHFFEVLAKVLDCTIQIEDFEKYKQFRLSKEKAYKKNKSKIDSATFKPKKVTELVKKVYKLLIKMCDKNPETQVHAFKFVQVYAKHIGLKLGATKLILAILGNNEELMLKVHDNQDFDLISLYSEKLLQFEDYDKTEFIEFLKSICVFKGEAVSVNQEKVFEAVILRKEIRKKALIKTFTRIGELYIRLRNTEFALLSCFEDGRHHGYEAETKYFTSLLELYSNLSSGRNFESSNYFLKKFPFPVLNSMIWNSNLLIKTRAAFCKLILTIYIDCVLREEVTKPELIKQIKYGGSFLPQDDFELRNIRHASVFDVHNDQAFNDSEMGMIDLLEKIFDYFDTGSTNFENEFTLQILQIVFKLIKFQIFSLNSNCSDSFSDSNSAMSERLEDSKMVRIIRAIFPILTDCRHSSSHVHHSATSNRKGTALNKKSNSETRVSYMHYLSSIIKDSRSLNDPVIRSAANLKNYLNLYKQNPFNGLENKKIYHRIKLKICKILEYFFDSRQDYLLNNVMKWFDSLDLYPNWNISDLSRLLPTVIITGDLSEIKSKIKNNNFVKLHFPILPDLQMISEADPVSLLLSSFTHCDNYKLQTSFLSIIFRCFSQRRELLKNIKKVHVVFRNQDCELIDWVKRNLLSFKHHSEQSEIWMNYWKYDSVLQQSKHKEVFNKIIEILKNLENFLFEDSVITETGPSFPKQKKISVARQEILNYLSVHKVIINLIRDGVHKLAELYKNPEFLGMDEPCMLLTNLFKSCYKVLKNFVLENSRNQKKLHNYIHIITQYLYLPLGQIPVICEVYRDNWQLINTVTENSLKLFDDLIRGYGRQKEFLHFLDVILLTNQKPNPEIQRLVLSLFIKEKLNFYNLYMISECDPRFDFQVKEKKNIFYNDEPYEYHAVLLQLLSKCGMKSSKKLKNDIKCQNIINLATLFDILNESQRHSKLYILKIPALKFLFNVYLDCESSIIDLKSFSGFFNYVNDQSYVIENSTEISEEFMRFLEIWIKILNKYRTSYIKKLRNSNSKQQDIQQLKFFCQVICKNCDKFEKKISRDLYVEISELCEFFEETFEIEDFFEKSSKIERKRTLINRSDTIVGNGFQNAVEYDKWNNIRKVFEESKEFRELIRQEEMGLVLSIYYCEKVKSTIMQRSVKSTNFENIVKTLIAYIRVSRSQKPPINILVLVINLLERIIANPLSEKGLEQEKTEMQYKMSYFGLTNVILNLMVDSQLERDIFKALISLSIQLLEGGNHQIQQEFYQYFLTSSNSEFLFYRIHKIIQDKIEQIAESDTFDRKCKPMYKEKRNILKITLRFLQLLCENHNHFLQTYLRVQEKSVVNYNMITSIIDLLKILMKKKLKFHFHIISQCFETLTEFIQGPCFENQVEIINSYFIEIASDLLSIQENLESNETFRTYHCTIVEKEENTIKTDESISQFDQLQGWMISHLKLKCLITIISLFEGRKDSTPSTRIIRSLNLEILQENIKNVYLNFKRYYKESSFHDEIFNHIKDNDKYDFDIQNNPQDINHKYFTIVIENGFLVYHLIKMLQDSDDPENKETLTNELSQLFLVEETNRASIWTMKRKKTKARRKKEIIESIRHMKSIGTEEKEKNEKLISEAYRFFKDHTGNIEVVFAGQIFRIYFYYPPEYKGLNKSIKNKFHTKAVRVSDQSKLKYMLDSALEIIALMKHEFFLLNIMKKSKTIEFISTNVDLFRRTAFILTILLNIFILMSYESGRDYQSLYTLNPGDKGIGRNTTNALLKFFGILQLALCILIVAFFLLKVGPLLAKKGWEKKNIKIFGIQNSQNIFAIFTMKLIRICLTFIYVLSNFDVIYYLLYAVFSVLGTTTHPFYFSLLLLDVIYRSAALQNVVNSIVLPRKALALTFLLLLVIIYISTILGYWLFFEDYLNPDCRSLLQCLLLFWDRSFKYDGGIGGFLGYPPTPSFDPIRFFYDNIYNIVVMIVLMGVVQGIIIDTFARLREEQEFCKTDMENKCFICGLTRDFIEKNTAKGFKYHKENDHNEWNYIMFIDYLLSKDPTEYSGIESYVREQIDKDELVWIPNQAALAINQNKEDRFSSKLKGICDELDVIEEHIAKIMS